MHFHVNENNLTADMELVIKRIDNIYRNKEICKSYVFNKSLLNKDTFVTLDQKYEKYIREFVKAIDTAPINCAVGCYKNGAFAELVRYYTVILIEIGK